MAGAADRQPPRTVGEDWTMTSMDAVSIIQWTARVAGFGSVCVGLQAMCQWRLFRDEDLLGWTELRRRRRLTAEGPPALIMNILFRFPAVLGLFFSQIIGGLLLGVRGVEVGGSTSALVAALLPMLLLRLRQDLLGSDGGHLMLSNVLAALLLYDLSDHGQLAGDALLAFIAGQAVLGYSVSGWRKFSSGGWRDRRRREEAFFHRLYVTQPLAQMAIGAPNLANALSLAGSVFLCGFPVALIGGTDLCLLWLSGGLAFHLFNAVVFGLPHFVITWGGCYPAIYYCSDLLWRGP